MALFSYIQGQQRWGLWVLSLFLFSSYLFSHRLFPQLLVLSVFPAAQQAVKCLDPAVRPHHHHSLLESSGHDESYQSGEEFGVGTQLGQPTMPPASRL